MAAVAKPLVPPPKANPAADLRAEVWVIDDEESLRLCVLSALKATYVVRTFSSIEEAEAALPTGQPAVILSDHYLPGENGLEFLTRLPAKRPLIQRILMTGQPDVTLLERAMNEGAVAHFLAKPFKLDELRRMADVAVKEHRAAVAKKAKDVHLDELEKEEQSMLQRWRKRWQRLWGWLFVGASGSLGVAGFALALGLVVLLVLYALKSLFGFDLFENRHLKDFF